jgi:hypothetical protein
VSSTAVAFTAVARSFKTYQNIFLWGFSFIQIENISFIVFLERGLSMTSTCTQKDVLCAFDINIVSSS